MKMTMKFKNNWLAILALSFLSRGLMANELEVPKSIDFKKSSESFDFSYHSRSSVGYKVGYSVKLYPNGQCHYSGIYLGEPGLACAEVGGSASQVLSDDKRQDLMIKAIKANNDNQKLKEEQLRGGYEEGFKLFVEHDKEMSDARLVNITDNVQVLRQSLLAEIEAMFKEQKNRKLALELKVKKSKDQLVYEITNVGNEAAVIHFPNEAGQHFFFRNNISGKIVYLQYQKNLHFHPLNLKKKESAQIAFKIPLVDGKPLQFDQGVFIYDNTAKVDYRDPDFVNNRPLVHLCNSGDQVK